MGIVEFILILVFVALVLGLFTPYRARLGGLLETLIVIVFLVWLISALT